MATGIETVKTNLLQTMKIDEEVLFNQDKECTVIESLQSALSHMKLVLLDRSDAAHQTNKACDSRRRPKLES